MHLASGISLKACLWPAASWQAAVGGSGEGEEGHLRASSRAMASEELTGFLKADGGKLNELPLGSAGLEVTEICGYI